MQIEKIKEKLNPLLSPHQLSIYSIKTKKEFGESILEILIDGEAVDTNLLESIHLKLLDELTDDELDPNYFLELSTVGIERPLNTPKDFEHAVSKYIYIESTKYQGNATLLSYQNDIIEIEINLKGRMKKLTINQTEVQFARLAVKF